MCHGDEQQRRRLGSTEAGTFEVDHASRRIVHNSEQLEFHCKGAVVVEIRSPRQEHDETRQDLVIT